MTTMVNGCGPAGHGTLARLAASFRNVLREWKRRRDAAEGTFIDQHFRRQREARERYLARAMDRYELERLERAFDRGDGENWRVY